ncbi:MAG: CPBP family intramembrane glutamic endopeptidase [Myxococcota bacterium]
MGDPGEPFRIVIANQLLFAAIAISGALLFGPRVLPRGLLVGRGRLGLARSAALVIGFVVLSHGLSLLLAQLRWSETGALAELGQMVGEMKSAGPPSWLLVITALGLAPAIGEELLFRGLIQQTARHWVAPGTAVLISALAFGILHFDLAQSSAAFLMGLYLGIAVERSGSLFVAMVAHGLNNTLGVVLPANAWSGLAPWAVPLGLGALAASAAILFVSVGRPAAKTHDSPPGD